MNGPFSHMFIPKFLQGILNKQVYGRELEPLPLPLLFPPLPLSLTLSPSLPPFLSKVNKIQLSLSLDLLWLYSHLAFCSRKNCLGELLNGQRLTLKSAIQLMQSVPTGLVISFKKMQTFLCFCYKYLLQTVARKSPVKGRAHASKAYM